MPFDDDDLEDYENMSGEEFHEDNLDDEEYDKLYSLLPKLKLDLLSYNDEVPEEALKEALYYNYYSIEEALAEIKGKYPKKKEIQQNQPVRQSKLSALAKLRAQRSTIKCVTEDSPMETVQTSSKPPSKLALLAKNRKAGLSGVAKTSPGSFSSLANKSLSILNSIGRRSGDVDPVESTSSPRSPNSSAELSTSVPKGELKTLVSAQNKQEEKRPRRKRRLPKEYLITPKSSTSLEITGTDTSSKRDSFPNQAFADDRLLKTAESSKVSAFLFNGDSELQSTSKRRRIAMEHHHDIFEPLTNNIAKKVAENFKEKSPDGKILEAQKEAFNSKLGDLTLKEGNSSSVAQETPKATKAFKKIDVGKVIQETHSKPHKSFVMIGHVDAGKSTTLGRLLFDVGAVDAKSLAKLTREAEKAGKGSFALAWILDQTTEERSRGVTVDIVATNFETKSTRYTAIDAPGHRDFVPQMINGVAQANYALVLVDAVSGEFETGLSDGQTKEHLLIAKSMGIDRVCVLVNKMDRENWSKDRFEEIESQMRENLTTIVGFQNDQIDFIPISGLSGDNLVKKRAPGTSSDWYSGPTVIEYLDNLPATDDRNVDKESFKLSINDIFEPTNAELQISGKIIAGTIQAGETVQILPSKEYLQVQGIIVNEKTTDVAITGDLALLKFKSAQLSNKAPISKGDMVTTLELDLRSSDVFTAEINLFEISKPLLTGTPFVLFKNNSHCSARITEILLINGAKKKKKHLVSKQKAVVEITAERLLVSTTYEVNHILGRIVLRREGSSIGAGQIIRVGKVDV